MSILRITLAEWSDVGIPAAVVGETVGTALTGTLVATPTADGTVVDSYGRVQQFVKEAATVDGSAPFTYDLLDPTDCMPSDWGWRISVRSNDDKRLTWLKTELPFSIIESYPQIDGVRTIPLETVAGLATTDPDAPWIMPSKWAAVEQSILELENSTRRHSEIVQQAAENILDATVTTVENYLTEHPPTVDLSGYVETTDPRLTDARTPTAHTHTSAQITDWAEAVQDAVAAMLTSGTNVTLSYNDTAGTLSVTAAGCDAEVMRDTIGAALVGVNGVTVTANDALDTITIGITGLTIAQVSGLQAALDGKAATGHTHSELHTHPAVIAQGATAAAARTAIGAGTSSFSGAYADLTGKPSVGSATRSLIITADDVPTIPPGDTTDNLAAYYNSAAVPITVAGVELAAGSHAVWAWVSGAWTLLAAGTGGTPPPDGEMITKAPAAPIFNTFAHTLTIPSDTGVTYQLSCTGAVSPVDALAGTWTVTTGAFASVDTGAKTITFTAYPGTVYVGTTAQAGYLLSEPSSWSAEFAETVSPYVAAAPADTQYLFVLDDAPGTTIPANSGTAGTTGVGRSGTLTYGAVTSGVGATAVKGYGAADIRLNGVLTSAATAWTWCAVVTAPVGKGLNLSTTDETTDPVFKAGYSIFAWNMVRDWNSKNAATLQWGTPSLPGVRGNGPTTPSPAREVTRTWAKGDRLFVAATWDGTMFKAWLGDASGLQLASSVADAGPVTTAATWQILTSAPTGMTDTNAPLRSVGGLIAHVGRAFTQAELEALNNAVVRP